MLVFGNSKSGESDLFVTIFASIVSKKNSSLIGKFLSICEVFSFSFSRQFYYFFCFCFLISCQFKVAHASYLITNSTHLMGYARQSITLASKRKWVFIIVYILGNAKRNLCKCPINQTLQEWNRKQTGEEVKHKITLSHTKFRLSPNSD